jgi:ribosomal-protein-alanine N-acetyltransferase
MRFISAPLTREQVADVIQWFEAQWEKHGFGWFAVFEKLTSRFVGQCGMQFLEGREDSGQVEISYVMAKEVWGFGYGKEAAEVVLRFGFETVGLNQIFAVSDPRNLPPIRILDALGFRDEGEGSNYGRPVRRFRLARSEWQDQSGRSATH